MIFYDKTTEQTAAILNSDLRRGLDFKGVEKSRQKYGNNQLTESKKRGFFTRFTDALKEPMLIILLFGFALALGVNLGKFFKTGEADFMECFGILAAVVLSVTITLIMEGSSEKAFAALNRIYDNLTVKVIRNGTVTAISQREVVVGDILLLESGDKIVADGRLIESIGLSVDESALTGESHAALKDSKTVLKQSVVLAERVNFVYSGTFVAAGTGKMIVTAIGDQTEIGNIAGELKDKKESESPLQQKLSRLGKIITVTGAVCAILVFVLSVFRLVATDTITFNGVQELFVSCIILIVAAVPEGLPTIVAVSLALNMIKLAKENALIKKMTATETAGAVSVICSDKTGTLTQNKMSVVSVCLNDFCIAPEKLSAEAIHQNFICNSTADVVLLKGRKTAYRGNATECALIEVFVKANPKIDYREYRNKYSVLDREPFSSDKKTMTTTIEYGGKARSLLKGAPEMVLKVCKLTDKQKYKLIKDMEKQQLKARRIICFAHRDTDGEGGYDELYIYDGYVAIADPIRPEVFKAVSDCVRAGIKIKMLTGDNMETAYAIARDLKVVSDKSGVVNASDLEALKDEELKKILPRISVIARSTPIIKLRVVRALKEMGEVVAVTGDGINDAPAIRHADVGIAMGNNGSEITKEAADVVLLDDSFATVVKAVSFGRNVYRNLQRFILFQLSVNLAALLFVTTCAALGFETPFTTLQLLWINVIMDGPPALTLGLESAGDGLMNLKPVKRSNGIVSAKMFVRILFNGFFMSAILVAQYLTNFMGVLDSERGSTVFTVFILFQLFNAFNSRELGSQSILKGVGKNKIMVVTFIGVFLVHLFIVQLCYPIFAISPMSFYSWLKCIGVALSIVVVSEIYKLIYRLLKNDSKSGVKGQILNNSK